MIRAPRSRHYGGRPVPCHRTYAGEPPVSRAGDDDVGEADVEEWRA
jgi:hypothetical protein